MPRNAFLFNRCLLNVRICPGIQLFSVKANAPHSYGKLPNVGPYCLVELIPAHAEVARRVTGSDKSRGIGWLAHSNASCRAGV
ncbi:hypothetical protein JQR88_11110 [Pseudomonas luteola]|uniref:hypothetical protein n=1 Tax=Pseudomonas luteola TaxID=47886 RepID=UPI003DA05D83